METKSILITGAGGFVGAHLVKKFNLLGYMVYAAYRSKKENIINIKNINLINLNLPNISNLPKFYNYLIHCGADTSATTSNDEKMIQSNSLGSEKIFYHASKMGVEKIVYLSSMSIYGDIKEKIVNEDYKPLNVDTYGQSKFKGEIHLEKISTNFNIPSLSIRLPGVVGLGAHNNFLSKIIPKIINNEEISINNPKPESLFNNLIHINDLFEYIKFYLSNKIVGYNAVNIAASEPESLKDLIESTYEKLSKKNTSEFNLVGKSGFLIDIRKITNQGFKLRTTKEMYFNFINDLL